MGLEDEEWIKREAAERKRQKDTALSSHFQVPRAVMWKVRSGEIYDEGVEWLLIDPMTRGFVSSQKTSFGYLETR